jgi:CheY-like chemotaxis protein
MLSPTVLLRHPTILVVDDEEPMRRYMSRVMEDGGYRCLTARDGVEALLLVELDRFPVQLVITDVSMPRMSGPELAAHLATRPHRPPVLFVSGDDEGTDLPAPLLRKPFFPGDLSELVNGMVRGRTSPALVLKAV